MSDPDPPSEDGQKPRDFRQVVALYALAPVVTHVAAVTVVLTSDFELGPLAVALLVGSTITIVVLVLVGLLAFRR